MNTFNINFYVTERLQGCKLYRKNTKVIDWLIELLLNTKKSCTCIQKDNGWITTRRLGVGVWGVYRFWASRIDTGKKNRDDQKPLGRKDNRPPIDSFATDKEVQALEVSGPHKGAAMLPEGSKPCHAPNVLPSQSHRWRGVTTRWRSSWFKWRAQVKP